jgi:peptidylprolyl isomerase
VRKLLVLLATVLLLATACGHDGGGADADPANEPDATSITGVSVGGGFGEKPDVAIDTPLEVEETTVDTLTEGEGDKVSAGDTVVVDYVGLLGRTGDQFDSSYDRGEPATFSTDGVIPGFAKAVEGQTVGSRVVVAVPPEDGYGPQGGVPDAGIEKDDTLVFVLDIVAKPLPEATGAKQELPGTLPELQLDDEGHPTKFTATRQTADAPEELVSEVAIKGEGAEVIATQTLIAHYVGQIYPDGKVFDSSWANGAPVPFPIGAGQVIRCWDKALVGQTVGSRVILVCPPAEGYGEQGNPQAGIKGTDTLIFSVDILAAY